MMITSLSREEFRYKSRHRRQSSARAERAMAASDAPPREDAAAPVVTASDVASYLLKRGNIASAFEYYQDLIDATSRAPGGDGDDDEDDASSSSSAAAAYAALEAYFADQRRFPSAELREHADVVDIPGLVATARELASRVAVAEYDARVAAEDAATARAELEASRRARALRRRRRRRTRRRDGGRRRRRGIGRHRVGRVRARGRGGIAAVARRRRGGARGGRVPQPRRRPRRVGRQGTYGGRRNVNRRAGRLAADARERASRAERSRE